MDSSDRHPDPVPWTIFIWAASIIISFLIAMLGWGVSLNSALAKEKEARISGDNLMQVQQAAIQTDLKNIQATLLELKAEIKNIR